MDLISDEILFCENQSISTEGDVLCLAHMAEARVPDCPWRTPEDRLRAVYPCSDYAKRGIDRC